MDTFGYIWIHMVIYGNICPDPTDKLFQLYVKLFMKET